MFLDATLKLSAFVYIVYIKQMMYLCICTNLTKFWSKPNIHRELYT